MNVEIWRRHHGPAIPVSRSLSIRYWLANLLGISLQCPQLRHLKMADLRSTARTPGNRIPRKVEWIDENREKPVVQATGSCHLLDERACALSLLLAPKLPSNTSKPTGFHELTEALQKHWKATTPLTHVDYYPPTPLSDSVTRDDIRPGGLYTSSSAPSSVVTFYSSPLTQPPSPIH